MAKIEYDVYREYCTGDNNHEYYYYLDTTDTDVKITCPKCGGLVDPWDKYCRHCGTDLKEKVYCLFVTCGRAKCGHDDYIVTMARLTLEQAEKKYPNVKFCQDWIPKSGEG